MFKKIVFTVASLLAMQGLAMAASTQSGKALEAIGVKFTPSNNVKTFYFSDAQNYTVNAKHTAGDRQYSTSNKVSNIYYTAVASGTDITAASTPTTITGAESSAYGAGWTAQ